MYKLVYIVLCLGWIIIPLSLMAQNPCACCTENHKAFDFWVGDWMLYDMSGNKIGENNIAKIGGNCILNEHWIGSKGGIGSSYNYYDPIDATWNQFWIDNQGGNLIRKGIAYFNKMILKSKFQKGKRGNLFCSRITWTLNSDGSMMQRWDTTNENDDILSVASIGIYTIKEK